MKTSTRISKYNVKKDKTSRTYTDANGTNIVFDSELELRYFIEQVLPGIASAYFGHIRTLFSKTSGQ